MKHFEPTTKKLFLVNIVAPVFHSPALIFPEIRQDRLLDLVNTYKYCKFHKNRFNSFHACD